MLKLYWGMDWQANRAAILTEICDLVHAQREAIWIVPEQASFEAEQLLCQRGGSTVSLYAQVLSFTRLANRVFSLCGGLARQTMDKGGQVLAMAQALEQVRSRLKLYAAGSRRPAFLGTGKAMRETIRECLDRVHAADLMDKRVGALSGGELQRVLLALALEPIPNILILDEPLSGVDVEGQTGLMDMLDELRKTYDLSILMTTHDFSILERYADQVMLIDHSVKAVGSASEVLASDAFRQVFHRGGGAV